MGVGCVGGYTSRMDRVRFGRALGFGARQAVKTLVTAVDAATAADPSEKSENAGGNSGHTPLSAPERADVSEARPARPPPKAGRRLGVRTNRR